MAFMDFGRVFTSDKLSAIMSQWTAPTIGWPVTIAPLRQINTAFRRKHCCGADEDDDDDDVASVLQVLQAGHSKSVDEQHYGLSHNAALGITDEVLFAFLDATVRWQKVLKVVPGGLALPYHQATRKNFDTLVLQEKVKKASRTVAVEGDSGLTQILGEMLENQRAMLKSQQTMLKRITTLEKELASFRSQTPQISQSPWTSSLQHLLTANASDGTPMEDIIECGDQDVPVPDISMDLDLDDSDNEPDPHLLEPPPPNRDLLESLKELLGPDATWKNKLQYDSVQALVALERDVIMALKTGDGKTLAAVLPSRVENGYTVIVVPLKSLMDDWERCLKGFNIPYERWLGAENPKLEGLCNLILVSSDMCRTSPWKTAIAELNARRPVLRRVYDEAQFYGTKEDFGEETFETPYDMREMDTQVVLMSATIPPRMQSYLADQFQLVNPLRISNTSDRPGLVTRIGGPYSTFSQQVNAAKDLIKQLTGNIEHLGREQSIHYLCELIPRGKVSCRITWPRILPCPFGRASHHGHRTACAVQSMA
jgi:hypothetical protein